MFGRAIRLSSLNPLTPNRDCTAVVRLLRRRHLIPAYVARPSTMEVGRKSVGHSVSAPHGGMRLAIATRIGTATCFSNAGAQARRPGAPVADRYGCRHADSVVVRQLLNRKHTPGRARQPGPRIRGRHSSTARASRATNTNPSHRCRRARTTCGDTHLRHCARRVPRVTRQTSSFR